MKTFVLMLALVAGFSSAALAHSGGTDANGCHAARALITATNRWQIE